MSADPVALSAPLQGLRLIEASAGTGKTWTLSGLYLRLIVERGVAVDRILAVTFTKAATAELRDRIRARLAQMLDRLEGRSVDDDFVERLLARLPDAALARRRLQAALSGIDESAIYTIHGFCQRVLSDRAFSTAQAFDHDIAADTGELLREVVLDFWRLRIAPDDAQSPQAGPRFIAWLQQRKVNVGALTRWVGGLIGKPGLQLIAPQEDAQIEARAQRYGEARARAAALWLSDGAELRQLLSEHAGLNRSSYNKSHLPKRYALCTDWLAADDDIQPPEAVACFSATRLAARNKGGPLTQAFFVALDELLIAADELQLAFQRRWRGLRLQLLDYARGELPSRLRAQHLLSYDDLLRELHQALHGEGGERLAVDLRARYPAALIDEFQDTDPLQWGIVERIYADAQTLPEPPVAFLVGDPKQSIYSFRGADIHAYLAAKARCQERHELLENQRSVAAYVEALNALYRRVASPFRHDDIVYHAVVTSPRAKPALIDAGQADAAPLRLVYQHLPDAAAIKDGEAWAAQAVAAQIAQLLAQADAGELRYGARPLRAGDIAVLVNQHQQASALRGELGRLGIACALRSNQSVFDTAQAEQLERLLIAVTAPHRASTLKAALMSELIGFSAQQVLAFERDEREWERLLSAFERYHELWRDRGFMRMFREIGREQGIVQRIAGMADGERQLTNLFHLAELLHVEQASHAGMESLLAWLAAQRGQRAGEDAQLRLESDADLVQIVTIHSSKGLEYPVVFLPFLWTARSRDSGDDLPVHHAAAAPHALCIDGASDDASLARQLARDEELAERLRLAYVALTRAKNRCYLYSGYFKPLAASPLGTLLHGCTQPDADLPDSAVLLAQLQDLAASSGGGIRLLDRSDEPPAIVDRRIASRSADAGPLSALQLRRPLPSGLVVSSYTRLLQDAESLPATAGDDDLPDHDQRAPATAAALPSPPPGGSAAAFPRGAAAGVCLHSIYEQIDASASPSEWRRAIGLQLRIAGYPVDWTPAVADWIADVVATPMPAPDVDASLDTPAARATREERGTVKYSEENPFLPSSRATPGVSRDATTVYLADIAPTQRIVELGFHLPAPDLQPSRLADIAQAHGLPVSALSPQRLQGYLRGFIDLCFEHRDRWYIADYKSNWLGGSAADYEAPALEAAMRDGDYHLQYLLYTLALHRWLGWRVPGYDYDRDFGGVFYLFLRGMDRAGRGVYAARPPRALIDALDALFRQEALA